MGGKGMNGRLGAWLKDNYEDVKSDLFSAFIVRNTEMTLPKGQLGFMSPFVWMFLSSYEKLRSFLINQKAITSLVQLEYSGFDGATVPICTFTVENYYRPRLEGGYVRLSDFRGSENQGPRTVEAIKNPDCGWFYRAAAVEFQKIPGSPIAYWVSPTLRDAFQSCPAFSEYSDTRIGLITGDNDYYIRQWHEISIQKIGMNYTREEAAKSEKKWFPQSKGGDFRRWYGNHNTVLDWSNDGNELQTRMHDSGTRTLAHNFNLDRIFLEGITWTKISSGTFGARFQPKGFLFNDASANAFPRESKFQYPLLAFLCSKLPVEILKAMNPTLNFLPGNVAQLPIANRVLTSSLVLECSKTLVRTSKSIGILTKHLGISPASRCLIPTTVGQCCRQPTRSSVLTGAI
jgi:hypothetical protein